MSSRLIMLIFLSLSYDQFCCNFYIFLNFFVIFIIFYTGYSCVHRLQTIYLIFFILDIIIIIVDLMHVRILNEYLCSQTITWLNKLLLFLLLLLVAVILNVFVSPFQLRQTLVPMLKGQTHLIEELYSFFEDTKPPLW